MHVHTHSEILKTNKEEEELKHLGNQKIMTSLSSPGKKAEERNAQSFRKTKVGTNNLEIGLDVHKYPNMNHKSPCLGLNGKKKKQRSSV